MSQKKNNFIGKLLFLALAVYMVWPCPLLAADPNIRIEMERATRDEGKVAITQFVQGKNATFTLQLPETTVLPIGAAELEYFDDFSQPDQSSKKL